MFGNVFVTGFEMTAESEGVVTDIRTSITFVSLPGAGDCMFMGNVSVEVPPCHEVFVTALDCTIKTLLLLYRGCHLALIQYHEAKI